MFWNVVSCDLNNITNTVKGELNRTISRRGCHEHVITVRVTVGKGLPATWEQLELCRWTQLNRFLCCVQWNHCISCLLNKTGSMNLRLGSLLNPLSLNGALNSLHAVDKWCSVMTIRQCIICMILSNTYAIRSVIGTWEPLQQLRLHGKER
jgi:hypothetical protein